MRRKSPLIILPTIFILLLLLLVKPISAQQDLELAPSFYDMFENHGSIMLLIDATSGDLLYANKSAANFYGYSQEELTKLKISDINTLSDEEVSFEMESAVKEERNFFVFKHLLANGEIRTVEVYSYPYVINETPMLFSIINDVTEKAALAELTEKTTTSLIYGGIVSILLALLIAYYFSKKNKELREATKELNNFNKLRESLINADDRYIYLKNENLEYVFVNEALKHKLNLSEDEIVGNTDEMLSNYEFSDALLVHEKQVVDEAVGVDIEIEVGRSYYLVNLFPILLLDNSYGVGAYIENITQIKAIERIEKKASLRNEILTNILTNQTDTKDDLLTYVLEESLKLTESDYGHIYVYDEAKDILEMSKYSKSVQNNCKLEKMEFESHLKSSPFFRKILNNKESEIINNFDEISKMLNKGHVPINNLMSIPVVVENKVLLTISLANSNDEYIKDDLENMHILLTGLWNVLERKAKTSELISTNQDLYQSKEQIQLLLNSTVEGIYGINKEGSCTIINKSAINLLGYSSQEELIGEHMHSLIHHSYPDGSPLEVKDCKVHEVIMSGEGQHSNSEVFWRRDGSQLEVEYFAYPQVHNGEIIGAVVTFIDNSERKKYVNHIKHLSYHDSLTGLYNRIYFEEKLHKEDVESNMPLSIIFSDINGLKLINDVFGHQAGDQLLIEAAESIKKTCRDSDILARVGGDEFAIILPNTNQEQARIVIERIKAKLAQIQVEAIKGSISIGSATKIEEEDIERVMQDAEQEMYKDKVLNKSENDSMFINNLIDKLFSKSERIALHSENVSILSRSLAQRLELDQDDVSKIEELAKLHDIGKVAFSQDLLQSEDSLSSEEKKQLERHSSVGFRILSLFDETVNIAEGVLFHHEHWDGSGYPKGSCGEDIPIEARIVAIAEVYDSLTNEYNKDKLSKDTALRIISEEAGKKLDPNLTRIFIEMMQEKDPLS